MSGEFDNIPEAEVVTTNWRSTFSHLAQRARETTFGLPDPQRRVLGVAVLLDRAEAELEELRPLKDELAGLKLTLARYKKAAK